jgi:hypothetical protein
MYILDRNTSQPLINSGGTSSLRRLGQLLLESRLRRVQKGVPWNPCPLALGSVRVRPGAPKWVELIGVVGAPHRLWVVDAYPAHQISAAAHEQQQWTDGGRVPPFAIGGPLRARSGHRVPSCSMILHRA